MEYWSSTQSFFDKLRLFQKNMFPQRGRSRIIFLFNSFRHSFVTLELYLRMLFWTSTFVVKLQCTVLVYCHPSFLTEILWYQKKTPAIGKPFLSCQKKVIKPRVTRWTEAVRNEALFTICPRFRQVKEMKRLKLILSYLPWLNSLQMINGAPISCALPYTI